ncbi:MAG TPA: hypothetical protein VJA17_04225 [Candidatus Omnitrophota bacterium]|nr:hypothetical protein [Candidatus Omnitrophota bacterium]
MIKIAERNISIPEARRLISRMPIADKIQLFRKLQKETWAKRIDTIRHNIDKRRRRLKISMREISSEIERARRDFYARSR